jgi:hypothetical protein
VTLQTLRHAKQLARLVLAWFVLSVGVAIASPWVHPQSMDVVCSSAGTMKLVVAGDDNAPAKGPSLDCPLCASVGLPPPIFLTTLTHACPLGHATHAIAAAHIAANTAPPLPSRGPPTPLC